MREKVYIRKTREDRQSKTKMEGIEGDDRLGRQKVKECTTWNERW